MYCSECGKFYTSDAKSCSCDLTVAAITSVSQSDDTKATKLSSKSFSIHKLLNELGEKIPIINKIKIRKTEQ